MIDEEKLDKIAQSLAKASSGAFKEFIKGISLNELVRRTKEEPGEVAQEIHDKMARAMLDAMRDISGEDICEYLADHLADKALEHIRDSCGEYVKQAMQDPFPNIFKKRE